MLTRDLLRYRNRKERVYPTFIKADDATLLAMAADLIAAFQGGVGSRLSDIEEELSSGEWGTHPLVPALKKLLLDRCDEAEDDGAVATTRADLLALSERLRRSADFQTLSDFQTAMARERGQDLISLQEQLYADLPEFRPLKDFKSISPQALLHRYNCAQVQGLLMMAQEVEVTILAGSLAERRSFFRGLKFMRLLSEVLVDDAAKTTTCKLSGPLRIFQNAQSYGLRLAQFFPYVLQLPRWRLTAIVKINGKVYELEIDHKVAIDSHYKKSASYIPPELTSFISAFNERGGSYQAAIGEDFMALGQQSYCFPDVTFTTDSGEKVHLEIFHRWHVGQLPNRLKAVESGVHRNLIIGVADDVAKAEETASCLKNSAWFTANGFTFKNMPTPKAVQDALKKRSASNKVDD